MVLLKTEVAETRKIQEQQEGSEKEHKSSQCCVAEKQGDKLKLG